MVRNPDQVATKVMRNLTSRFPDATHVVLFVTTDPRPSQIGAWHAMAIGPGNRLKTVQEVEGVHLNDTPLLRMYPVAWVELKSVRNRNF
jgi:hypothetical protein